MYSSNLKIFLSIALSLIIFFGINYILQNPEKAKNTFYQAPNIIISSIKTLNPLPFFSQITKKVFNPPTRQLANSQNKIINNNPNSFNLPTSSFQFTPPSPTQTQKIFLKEPIITKYFEIPTEKPKPTIIIETPKLTKTPKPTLAPKPTSTPPPKPITSDQRPGSNLDEIFDEVSKRTCIPKALLWAFKTVETGERFKNDNQSTIKIYNTYGWWKDGSGDPCYGYGYHTQTGIIPQDSIKAGERCAKPIGNPNDLKIMGLFQISEWEQQVSRKLTIKDLPNNIDRRVLFDNTLIFSYITRNRIPGGPPENCDNWPADIIKKVAEKHHGVCQYDYGNGAKGNYCQKILDLYKQYK